MEKHRTCKAAMAVQRYVEATVRYIFGDSLGYPLADEISHIVNVLAGRRGALLRGGRGKEKRRYEVRKSKSAPFTNSM
jgi:hypothetical protein